MPYITLKHDAQCADCGAPLPAGTKARWFRNGDVYGNECHRWQVGISRRRQLKLQEALRGLLHAARNREIPDAVRDRLAALKPACGRQLTASTWKWLMTEAACLTKALEGSPQKETER